MSDASDPRLKRLFVRAAAIPHDQVEAFLARECAADPALLRTARALLGLDVQPDALLGPYQLLHVLGQGSFGVVWLAQRSQPFSQQVAIKILKRGMDSDAFITRFEFERQALALMNHPAIASVLDAGTTPQGLPYLVMEYIQGEHLTKYCDLHRLGLSARLRLFRDVCDAVHHAHSKGVIHRDLKPANILVSGPPDAPLVKIIDFGVARALNHSVARSPATTEVGRILGTLEYMSPEQAHVGNRDVDIRSDIYSLGVILYELLAGVLPFPSHVLQQRALEEGLRVIREDDAPSPSTQLHAQPADAANTIAAARDVAPASLHRVLRRELEWIPMMAMRKDPLRRYASAAQFAQDIDSYLQGLPVIAAPESRSYRARKFLAQHRLLVGTSLAIAGVLSAATFTSAHFARTASRQRTLSEQYASFVFNTMLNPQTLVDANDPDAAAGTRLVDLLNASRPRIATSFPDSPAIQSRLNTSFARLFLHVGKPQDAVSLITDASTAPALLTHDEQALRADITTEATYRLSPTADQLTLLEQQIAQRPANPPDETTLSLRNQRGGILKSLGRWDEARAEYVAVLSARTTLLGPTHLDTLITRHNINLVDLHAVREAAKVNPSEALTLCQTALAQRRQLTLDTRASLGPDHWQTLASQAEELGLQGELARIDPAQITDPDAIIASYRSLLQRLARVSGSDSWRTLQTRGRFARLLRALNRHDAAVAQLSVLLDEYARPDVYGPLHNDTLTIARWLAESLHQSARSLDACRVLIEADDAWRNAPADDQDLAAPAMLRLAALGLTISTAINNQELQQRFRALESDTSPPKGPPT